MQAALVVGDRTRTHGELDERADRLANVLLSMGAEPGGRLAVVLPNGFELFEANLAAARLRCLLVPVNWHLKVDELRWILGDCGARVVVAHQSLADQVGPAAGDLPVLWVGEDYEAALAAAPSTAPDVGAVRGPALMLYTSGTEGRPKGVVHQGLVQAGPSGRHPLVEAWGLTSADVHCLCGPAYHGAPWSYASTHLSIGATVVVLPRWDARTFLAAVDRHEVTNTFLVPTHMAHLVDVPDADLSCYDLSSLRLVLHGGAPCPVDLKRRFLDAFPDVEVHEFYGFSEGGRATRISSDEWRRKPGSVGRPWPGTEVRVLDPETGSPAGTGDVGLVYVRPLGGMRFHYEGDDAKTAAAWRDDACTAGDLGYLDDDGYLFLTDRAADMVCRGGVNLYPREVEDGLLRHPAVADCAVVGRPDPVYGEQLHAVVELRRHPTAAGVTADDLAHHCRSLLADFKCPTSWAFVERLPRDPNGKVRKGVLRAELRSVGPAGTAGA